MFIMNTRSTIAVMSNSGVSKSGLRAISSSEPGRSEIEAGTISSRAAPGLTSCL